MGVVGWAWVVVSAWVAWVEWVGVGGGRVGEVTEEGCFIADARNSASAESTKATDSLVVS